MKTLIKLISIICILFISCKKKTLKEPLSVCISILDDITDKRLVHPTANTIYSLASLDKDVDKEVRIKMQLITDMIQNNSIELYLPNSTVTDKENKFDDAYYRRKKVKAFNQSILSKVTEYNQAIVDTSRNFSECYNSIVKAVKEIKEKKCKENYLVIYSDLLENSKLLNVYENGKIRDVDTSTIHKAFSYGKQILDSLQNVTVLFIFQSKQREEDALFQKFYDVYKSYFEKRGAKVFLKSNNLNNNL